MLLFVSIPIVHVYDAAADTEDVLPEKMSFRRGCPSGEDVLLGSPEGHPLRKAHPGIHGEGIYVSFFCKKKYVLKVLKNEK